MVAPPRLSVVIPTHNTCRLTMRCIRSVVSNVEGHPEVVVVDDASEDDTVASIRSQFPEVMLHGLASRSGFTTAANSGISRANGELILTLNSDTELAPATLQVFTDAFVADPDLGIAGGCLLYPDGRPQWSSGPWPTPTWLFGVASGLPALLGRLPGYRKLKSEGPRAGTASAWVSGAAMAIRRSTWDQVGPFDERYDFYCQDLDLCRSAVAAGWAVRRLSAAKVMHHHGATISSTSGAVGAANPRLLWSDLLRYAAKHGPGVIATYRALALGGRLRVMARRTVTPVIGKRRRASWRSQTIAYNTALRALAETRRSLDHPGPASC